MKGKVFVIIALCIFLTGILYGCIDIKGKNKAPTCNLNANPTSGSIPLTVTFTMTASDPDGTIASWSLDINNDGSIEYSGSGQPPYTKSHIYQTSGSYKAKLRVRDNNGTSATDIVTISSSEKEESYKASCRDDITYAQLNSNTDLYKKERVAYKGQIEQVITSGKNAYRIDVGSSDILYVTLSNWVGYNEDDFVQVWGEVKGTYSYKSIAGWKITIPHIEAKYVEKISFKLNLGETAQWQDLEVTIKSSIKTSSYSYTVYDDTIYTVEADPGRTFIILDVNVKMVGDDSEYVYADDFWLVDSEGYKYDYDSGTYHLDGGLEGTTIYQNQQMDGKILFDVPIDASGLKAQYNLAFSNNPLLAEWTLNL